MYISMLLSSYLVNTTQLIRLVFTQRELGVMGTGDCICGKHNIIDVGEWPQVCRRGKNTKNTYPTQCTICTTRLRRQGQRTLWFVKLCVTLSTIFFTMEQMSESTWQHGKTNRWKELTAHIQIFIQLLRHFQTSKNFQTLCLETRLRITIPVKFQYNENFIFFQ